MTRTKGIDVIYLDLDGVLVDFMAGVARVTGTDRDELHGPRNRHWKGLLEVLSEDTGETWDEKMLLATLDQEGESFWTNLPKYPWADDLLDLCSRAAPTVIMTSPSHIPSAASGKMSWIFTNLPAVENYAITSCKHHMAHPGALLVDDSVTFCEDFRRRGGSAYLFPQPWSDPDGWGVRDPLAEIEELIRRLS